MSEDYKSFAPHCALHRRKQYIYIHELFTTHVSFKRHRVMSFVLLFWFFVRHMVTLMYNYAAPICSRQPMPCISVCRSSDIARCRLARCRLCEHFLVVYVKSFGDVLMYRWEEMRRYRIIVNHTRKRHRAMSVALMSVALKAS